MSMFCIAAGKTIVAGAAMMAMLCPGRVEAAEFHFDGRRFTLPDGFVLERIAGPPLVDRPISADYDEAGRLYVSDSSGSNEDVHAQLKKRPHRIVRLADADGDGRFDRSVVFADKMMFPEGVLWHDGSLYVAAPPSIWKLTDIDGDGVADRREEWFAGKTLTGCANDLHGPYLGPDGWIYWCKGAFAQQTYPRPGREPLVTRAAHIFRRQPDGSVIEPVMTGGMDNPVEVVFTPGGERIFTTTFLQHPGGGRRDGLIHAVYGGVYGKVHGVIQNHPRTGPVMPVLAHLDAAVPCGLVLTKSDQLGDGFQDNLFAALFNMRKITRHVLKRHGATFKTIDEDFLVCDDLDFHPTDVLEDADGSLIIVDTGGWYKLCCPTSQLWKPDVLGAIYRVRRAGGEKRADPRGRRIDWSGMSPEALARWLGDDRPAVRERAKSALARRGAEAVPALKRALAESGDGPARLHCVWALSRIDDPAARSATRAALADSDEQVRQAAVHSASAWRDRHAASQLIGLLTCSSLHNRRAAAEALGRIGDAGSVPPLLAAAGEFHDRELEHSLIYAMIEIADAGATRRGAEAANPHTRRAALVALDQMDGGDLASGEITPLLESSHDVLRETAWWIAGRHPDWAPTLAGWFGKLIHAAATDRQEMDRLPERLAQFARDATIEALIAAALREDRVTVDTKLAVLDAMARSGQGEMPAAWSGAIAELLASKDPCIVGKAVSTVAAFSKHEPDRALQDRLTRLARDANLTAQTRMEALAVAAKRADGVRPEAFRFAYDHLAVDQPVSLRALAVDVLTGARLSRPQLDELAESLVTTGPMELKRLLAAFDNSREERLGLKLVAALQRAPAAASIPEEELRARLAKFGDGVSRRAESLLVAIRGQRKEKRKLMESILALSKGGDVRRGQRVFHGTKAACASCHALGYLGGRVGPDLTRIGRTRSDRDLLEAILFPSASFVRSYEPTVLVTADGEVITGVVRDETEREVVLSIDAQKVIRVPHDQVEQRHPGKLSIMPAGLEKQLTRQELADLVMFLKTAN